MDIYIGLPLTPVKVLYYMYLFFSFLQVILIFTCVKFSPTKYDTYVFPGWADGLGLLLTLSSILTIPGTAVVKVVIEKHSSGASLWQVCCFIFLSLTEIISHQVCIVKLALSS